MGGEASAVRLIHFTPQKYIYSPSGISVDLSFSAIRDSFAKISLEMFYTERKTSHHSIRITTHIQIPHC